MSSAQNSSFNSYFFLCFKTQYLPHLSEWHTTDKNIRQKISVNWLIILSSKLVKIITSALWRFDKKVIHKYLKETIETSVRSVIMSDRMIENSLMVNKIMFRWDFNYDVNSHLLSLASWALSKHSTSTIAKKHSWGYMLMFESCYLLEFFLNEIQTNASVKRSFVRLKESAEWRTLLDCDFKMCCRNDPRLLR